MSNPYTRLKDVAKEFARKIQYRKSVEAFNYTSPTGSISLSDLIAHVETANTLGYNTELYVNNKLLHVRHLEMLPSIPWEIR